MKRLPFDIWFSEAHLTPDQWVSVDAFGKVECFGGTVKNVLTDDEFGKHAQHIRPHAVDVEETEMMNRKPPVSPDAALASEVFDHLCAATTLKAILQHHRHLCDILKIKPTNFPHFYPKLKAKLGSWKAQALWNKFDKRASHKCYNRGKACSQTKVLIIGAGPCGLRAAIEAQLLGARVVVVEKRDRITRNNVLHLWPFVIQDLRGLGAKKFFGKFCAGAIDHISIRQLQCILLKVALILGVEIHEGVTFESLNPPPANQEAEKVGWRASVSPADHPVSQYEFDVLIGADGKRNTLEGFKRKEFRGKLAIAITANFINRRTEAEARVQEISGVAFIFNQKFFKDLYSETGIDLENIVYYKDDTHYFVMTAKKHSLIDKGVILQDFADTAKLLDPANVDKGALLKYAKEAADFSTNYMLPDLDFAVNHYGQPDVAMFDFTSMYAAENASRVVEKNGHKLLQLLVGDSLLEPFWPTGSGCARGFLSSMDACWAIKSWAVNGALSPLEVLAERESIYRLLGQTTPENLQKDPLTYTLDPHTRYPNLNSRSVLPHQVRNLFETDDPTSMELALTPINNQEVPKKKRRKDSQVHPDTLLQWLKRQVCLHQDLHVENMTYSFKSGLVLCAIISRYRPDLLDYSSLQTDDVAANNQRAFDILEKELGIPPVMTGEEMAECECPDRLTMLSYLSQVYDTFRGEIPHIKHPGYAQEVEEPEDDYAMMSQSKIKGIRTSSGRKRHSNENNRNDSSLRRSRKRRSGAERLPFGDEERQKRLEEIERNRRDRQIRRQYLREMQTEQFKKSVAMLECNQWTPENSDGFQDYSLYVYRQTAPEFTDRVKSLEMKLLYPDKESRLRAELKSKLANEPDEEFSGRIKDFEEKLLKGSGITQKKPRDLLRAIGKIEKTDWNVKEIEKKIEENKLGKSASHDRPEKVPKWSRQQFDDKFQAMERKLLSKGLDQVTASRYAEVDLTLKKLEQKLKEGSSLDTGQRGSNKVSAMAEQFAPKPEEKNVLQKSASKGAIVLPNQGSEKCHFCNKRVYVMERVSAEGKFFHRSCFKCEYCGSTLRVGNYMFDKEGKYGNRFYCNQHFGLSGTIKQRLTKNQERNIRMSLSRPKVKSPETPATATIVNKHLQTPPTTDLTDRGATPERIEFENLAEAASDVDEGPSEMDEDEWTDRNFGASAAEGSSDDMLDVTDSEEDDQDEILEEEGLMTADETRKAAERWTRRHSSKTSSRHGSDGNGQDSCEADDSEDFDENSQDDDSDTAIEGEEDIKALELRKQEVRLQPQRHRQDTDTGSDTEVATDERSSSDESSEEIENSATEISTDSEFEHDGSVPTRHEIPDILITDHNALRRNKPNEEIMKVQVKSGNIVKTNRNEGKGVKLEFSPLLESKSSSVLTKNTLNSVLSRPTPLLNPRRGDYLLSKTPSTEGIATKMSLELRKKYLLGNSGSTNAISKSGSATALDSRIKTFESNITQCQKLLNPASEISPTMQAFLQTTSKKIQPPSPTIITPALNLPPSSMIFRKQKELPQRDKDFVHICGKPEQEEEKKLNVLNENVRQKSLEINRKFEDKENKKEMNEDNKENEEIKEEVEEDKVVDNGDCRPRSPAHETSILVPQIPWTNKNSSENMSDSLSESESESVSSSSENEPAEIEKLKHMPPRLEIRNSKGELMDEEGFEPDSLQIFDDEYHSPMSMEKQLKLAKSKIDELKNSIARGGSDIQNANHTLTSYEKDDNATRNNVDDHPEEPVKETPLFIANQRKNSLTLALSKDRPSAEDEIKMSCPPSPASIDESCHTIAALTETELSDWARDGDNCVSEDFEDVENQINKEDSVGKDRKRSTEGKKPKSLDLSRGEPFMHVCGKDKPPKLLASNENLDFMDTDVSERDLISLNNEVFENKGYFRFVNEDEAATPVVEVQTIPSPENTVQDNSSSSTSTKSSSSSSNEEKPSPAMVTSDIKEDLTTEESTTSEQTTIKAVNKNFDICDETFYSPLIEISPISPKSVPEIDRLMEKAQEEGEKHEFEEYIQNLQGRISPFHNVRDSIDYRKSKQKTSKIEKVEGSTVNAIKEDEEKEPESPTKKEAEEKVNHEEPDLDPMSKKLQEISRERSLQKDLVHEMVMKKVLPGKKSPSDRKLRKITRTGSRILNGSARPLDTPSPVEGKEIAEVPCVDSSLEASHQSSSSVKSCKYTSNLPDTPLTNPDAFPNLNTYDFKTPVAPPRDKKTEKPKEPSTVERDKIREEARARARLKSDEELGLSPEEKMVSIRENANRLLETPIRKVEKTGVRSQKQFDFNLKNVIDLDKRVIAARKNESQIPKSSSTSKVFEKLRGGDKSPLGLKSAQKSTSDLITSVAKEEETAIKSLSSSGPSTSSSSTNKTESEKKRSRDRERRRSIIQAVSDFFHKKSPSPSKSPSPTKPDKFSSKFRLTAKSKDKKEFLSYPNSVPAESCTPPPVPPPPENLYKPASCGSVEESAGSETDEILSNMSTPTHGLSASMDSAAKRARMTKRMAAQAERKRLRMAQEIQRRLEEVEEKQKELESRGVILEKALRGEIKEEEKDDTELLKEWFELLRERNELRRYEKELMVRAQEVELEDRHARLQHELKNLLAKDDSCRTKEEVLQEGAILREMLDTVEKRGALTAILEQEQQRYQAEEKDLEAQVLAKGIRLTPIRKYEYQSAV